MKKQNKYGVYKRELTIFVNQMIKAYNNTNMLKEFLIIKEFKNQDKEFNQIARWVKLPKDFFIEEKGVEHDNSMIAGDFVRTIVNGEKNFILKSILESDDIPKYKIESFNYKEFVNIVSEMDNPTDIFIPLNSFFNSIYSWAYGNRQRIKFEHAKEPILLVRNKEIRVHWITSDTNINKIIVLDKDKIEVIQKTFEQSSIPKEIKPIEEFKHYSENKKLMLYFEKKDEKNLDFIFKTVISKPKLKEGSAIVINVKNKPEEK